MIRQVKQRGFALPAIIFLMVIVTLLIGYMARIQSSQAAANSLRIEGTRAYWAAKAGSQWAAYQINVSTSNTCAPAVGTLSINGFQVAMSCTVSSYTEGSNTIYLYEVTALAQNAFTVDSLDYVSRQITTVINEEN